MRTISDALGGRNNNFDLLRLIAAVVVLWWHSYMVVLGTAETHRLPTFAWLLQYGLRPGDIAVNVFFLISGLLIPLSFDRSRSIDAYMRSRALRIFPALLPAVLFTALIIGPLFTRLPVAEYLASADTWIYILRNAVPLHIQYYLPVFEVGRYPNIPNGSLWTLVMELRMYALVPLIAWSGLSNRPRLFNAALLALFALYLVHPGDYPLFYGRADQHARLAGYFMIGMAYYVNRSWIPLHGAVGVAISIITVASAGSSPFAYLFALTLGYWVFWFALHDRLQFHNAARFGDFSYGLYIYHFPIQQSLGLLYVLSPIELTFTSLAVTFFLAFMSWRYIERPALGLKRSLSLRFAPVHATP